MICGGAILLFEEWSARLKASVIGVAFAATLLAPAAAHAYGRATPTPNLFAAWSDLATSSQTATPSRPHRMGAARHAAPFQVATGRRWVGTAPRWRSRRTASLRLLDATAAAAPAFGGVAAVSPTVTAAATPSPSLGGGEVVAEAARWIGSGNFTGQRGPWCADAVSAWLRRSGHRPLDGRMASSALAYGPRLEQPEVGALAVLGSRRGWAYHVGVVSGVEPNGAIRLISGNWGRRVAEAVVPRGSVSAFVAVR
jgi:uncharacterized protein (TIGR02594 family)